SASLIPVQDDLALGSLFDHVAVDRQGGALDRERRSRGLHRLPAGAWQAVLWRVDRVPLPLTRVIADVQVRGLAARVDVRSTAVIVHSKHAHDLVFELYLARRGP